jgi:8-oxo-dGTP pyrophosphatase MutT (NUDIX family)
MSAGASGSDRGHPRPGSGEEYNPGPPTAPRQAASVIVLREGRSAPEVLLVRRTPKARFMAGVWVFPGGAVDETEAAGDDAHRAAAVRELREEAGLTIPDPAALIEFSRWITPAVVRTRYDTHFFLASLPPDQQPSIDGEECVDCGWFAPADALGAHHRGEMELVFPTVKHLEQLSGFVSVQQLLDHARGREVVPVEPHIRLEGEIARVLLPGDPGY